MSTIVIAALFTQGGGDPSTGLALADIDLYLSARHKGTGAMTAVWNPVNPTEEIGGGLYSRSYALADENTYDYYAWAEYTGAVVLDANYSLQASPGVTACCTHGPGAIDYTYTVTNTSTGLPEPGVEVWVTTDAAGTNVVWNGNTDTFGVARDNFGSLPWLDPGTYYFWKLKPGFIDADNPDIEVVS